MVSGYPREGSGNNIGKGQRVLQNFSEQRIATPIHMKMIVNLITDLPLATLVVIDGVINSDILGTELIGYYT